MIEAELQARVRVPECVTGTLPQMPEVGSWEGPDGVMMLRQSRELTEHRC